MSAIAAVKGPNDARGAARPDSVRRSAVPALMICGVVRMSQAMAGDQTQVNDHRFEPATSMHTVAAPAPMFSATEFRPRKPSALDPESGSGRNFLLDTPITQSNAVWQHMSDFQSQGRVRLLTLFQTRGSSLSLQAGKHGAPSLQWSTPWVRREGASRGLFDHLLSVPQHTGGGNAGLSARGNMPRPTTPAPSRPVDPAPTSNTN